MLVSLIAKLLCEFIFLLLITNLITFLLLIINFYISSNLLNKSFNLLLNVYECGFNPYIIQRKSLARFYLIAILFLLFDLELVYFFISIFINFYYFGNLYDIKLLYILLILILFLGMLIEYNNHIVSKSGFN